MLTRIEPPPDGLGRLRLGNTWREVVGGRELLAFLVLRNVRVQYAQAILGVGWVLLQPVLTLVTFTVFFGVLIGIDPGGVPYPVFAYAGILPWSLCANAVTRATTSLVESTATITKVYYPRLLVPLAALLARLVDFGVGVLLLVALFAAYGFPPQVRWIWILPIAGLAASIALAAGLWLGTLNVRYRDVQAALPFLLQLWFFATPIVYPSTVVPAAWRTVYAINPMSTVVDGFRWALLDAPAPAVASILVSASVTLVALASGLYVFRAAEPAFADRI